MGWFKKLLFIGCVVGIVFLTGFDETLNDWWIDLTSDDSKDKAENIIIRNGNCRYVNPYKEDGQLKYEEKYCKTEVDNNEERTQ